MRGSTWQAAASCVLWIRAASAVWSSAICAASRFSWAGAEPLTIGAAGIRRALPRAALTHQSRSAQPNAAGRRGQHLCRRKPVSGRHPAAPAGQPAHRSPNSSGSGWRCARSSAHAIRLGGSSVSDYVDADGERGFFQLEHCVYQRTGEPCRRCQTPIRRMVLAGRGTHYCPAVPALNRAA